MTTSPFARFNMFRNPFGELTVAERAELAVVAVDEYLAWLNQSTRAAIQVIGPCGHGKSTHLRAMQYTWAARQSSSDLPAFVYYPEEGDQPALPRSRPLFVDEAQRMSWWQRRQLLTRPGPLVIGTHRDLSRELIAAGFQLLTIDLDQPMPPERMLELLNRRIAASSLGHDNDAPFLLTIAQVVALQRRFGSNVRQVEDFLYDQFQSFALKGEPWLPAD